MKSWSVAEAKKHFSDMLDAVETTGPQRITHDTKPVVVVSEADWMRLVTDFRGPADLVLNAPFEPEDLPQRRPARATSISDN